jgi:hypothetical protein
MLPNPDLAGKSRLEFYSPARRRVLPASGSKVRFRAALICACFLLSGAAVARGPSFDCNKAHLPDESAICRTAEESELDNVVAAGYGAQAQRGDTVDNGSRNSVVRNDLSFPDLSRPTPSCLRSYNDLSRNDCEGQAADLSHTTMLFTESPSAAFDHPVNFTNLSDACDYFGSISVQCREATGFFSGSPPADANLLFVRIGIGGGRSRFWSMPVTTRLSALETNCPYNATLSLECDISIPNFDQSAFAPGGYTFTANFCADTSTNCGGTGGTPETNTLNQIANNIRDALDTAIFNFPTQTPPPKNVTATTTGSSIASQSCDFTGYIINGFTEVSSTRGCKIYPGGIIRNYNGSQLTFDEYNAGLMILSQNPGGTSGGAGEYTSWWINQSETSYTGPGTLTETYGILTIGHVTNNGLIAPGQAIAGIGIFGGSTRSLCTQVNCYDIHATGVMAYLDGGTNITKGTCTGAQCDGSRWIVSYAQTVAASNISTIPSAILKERGENFWRRGFPNQGKHDSR